MGYLIASSIREDQARFTQQHLIYYVHELDRRGGGGGGGGGAGVLSLPVAIPGGFTYDDDAVTFQT